MNYVGRTNLSIDLIQFFRCLQNENKLIPHLSVMSFENHSKSSMSYEVFLVVNKFTNVFSHRGEKYLLFPSVKEPDSFASSENFLASENEANLSPNASDVRGLCRPLVKRSNNITVIRPPWLHLELFPTKNPSTSMTKSVCFVFVGWMHFISPRKTKTFPVTSSGGRSLSHRCFSFVQREVTWLSGKNGG